MLRRLAPVALGLLILVPACSAATKEGPCKSGGAGFASSLASNRGGALTPEQAAQTFAEHSPPNFPAPRTGWHVTSRTAQGATVRSGSVQLHAIKGQDTTWQIESGTHCV